MPNKGYKKAKDKQDYKTVLLQIRLSPGDKQAIKQLAEEKGISIADLVRSLIPTDKQIRR